MFMNEPEPRTIAGGAAFQVEDEPDDELDDAVPNDAGTPGTANASIGPAAAQRCVSGGGGKVKRFLLYVLLLPGKLITGSALNYRTNVRYDRGIHGHTTSSPTAVAGRAIALAIAMRCNASRQPPLELAGWLSSLQYC